MALAAPDLFKETGLLAGILGTGTNVIQSAISAAIDRGKQASNLQAGQEQNFQATLNNAINRAVRKNEFDSNQLVRAIEFKQSTGLTEKKLAQDQGQFDARLLFDKGKEANDRVDALELLKLRKAEVGSLITSRANDDKRADAAGKREDRKLILTEEKAVKDDILYNLRISNELQEGALKDEQLRNAKEARARDEGLLAKSHSIFVTPPEGSAPAPLQVSPTATPEQLNSFIGEAITSKDPEILGRAQAIINTRVRTTGGVGKEELDTKFAVLDQANTALKSAVEALDKERKSDKPRLKTQEALVALIGRYQTIIGKEPKEVRAAWAARKGATVPGPGTGAGLQSQEDDYLPKK